jgi:DNA repair exonuclease SbcCD ATPase subunit
VAKRQAAENAVAAEKDALKSALDAEAAASDARTFVQKVAQHVQHETHRQVGRVVSRCLTAVFPRRYELKIEFVKLRGKTEAKFVYECDGRRLDPRTNSGGVRDVTALALRLAELVLTLPPARKFLALDEPFVSLSAGNLQRMASLIESLSEELGVQFLVATHSDSLKIGKVVQL